ncbi:hypothetical protein JCM5353_008490 [Sporobolomyces roseus]
MRVKEIAEPSSITSPRPRTSLCTLPDELLRDIFSRLPSSYILPPINRQFLPFHHSRLFRNVVLTFRNFDTFFRVIELNESLQQYPETLILDFSANSNPRQKNLFPPRRTFINWLLASLINLKDLVVKVDYDFDERFCPTRKDFSRNPKLQTIAVQSSLRGCDEIFEGTEVFDFETLRHVGADDMIEMLDDGEVSEPWMHGILLEVRKLDEAGNHGVRYYSNLILDHNFIQWCQSAPPITQFESVTLVRAGHLLERLRQLPNPKLLTHLSLFAIEGHDSSASLPHDYLAPFSNVTHLSVGGTAYLDTIQFCDTLCQLPLESLRIGPQTGVAVQHLIDLFTHRTKPNLSTLQTFALDNLDCQVPDDPGFAEYDEWLLPEWTQACSRVKVKELKEVLQKFGIAIAGSTFFGLEVEESDDLLKAMEREQNFE